MILPKPPMMTWEENLSQYGNAESIDRWKNSDDAEFVIFGNLLEEMKKLDKADLHKVNLYQHQLVELAQYLEEGLSVGVSDLVSDARRLLNANGVAY